MTHSSTNKSCPYFPHLGPVGCLPAPNIFPSANKFARGKMFWNKQCYKKLFDSQCICIVLTVTYLQPI